MLYNSIPQIIKKKPLRKFNYLRFLDHIESVDHTIEYITFNTLFFLWLIKSIFCNLGKKCINKFVEINTFF